MCFFTSLSANAAAVAKRYSKQLDIIEAARQILAEQEQEERARQEAAPEHKVSVYDIRLAEDIYVIPAYAEPQCVIVSGSDKLQVMHSTDGEARRCSALRPGKPVQERTGRDAFREMAVAAQLTVYPEKEMTAWPVRPKFNYGDPYDEGIIEPVAEMQKLGLGTQSCLNHTKREETDNGLPSGNESRHSSNT